MKLAFVIGVFISVCSTASAQVENFSIISKNLIEAELKPETAEKSLSDIFASVSVLDGRDNSSEIGYYSKGTEGKDWPKIYTIPPNTKDGITAWIAIYLQAGTNNAAVANTLFIVIKKLWLSSEATEVIGSNDKKAQTNQGFEPGLVTELEFYLQKDSVFYPMYKIDSILTYDKSLPKHAGFYFTESLKKSLEKMYRINFASVLNKGKKLSIQDIEKIIVKILQRQY